MTIDAEEYPMHAKLQPLQPLSQAVHEFLEWCGDEGIELAVYETDTRMWPVRESHQALIARYFEIDLGELEKEKCAMLDAIRAGRDV